jgi:L-cysteine desulfidase
MENLHAKILKILEEEIVVAEGCTEPNALAYAAALGQKYLDEIPKKIIASISGNIVKNVKGVIIPNSNGLKGIESALALGVYCGNSELGLMVITEVCPQLAKDAEEFAKSGVVTLKKAETDDKLYIHLIMETDKNMVEVEIKNLHTNITKLQLNGKDIDIDSCDDTWQFNTSLVDREFLTIELIQKVANEMDLADFKHIFEEVVEKNMEISHEGLTNSYGTSVGKVLLEEADKMNYLNPGLEIACYAAAGSDARMNGCSLPVMTTSGSGNQGMTASIPVIRYCQLNNVEEEIMYRALLFSHLSTIHIKTNIGRLSAFCGVICASAAVSGAISYIETNDYNVIAGAISNTLGNIAGVVCDGAKASCAMKINTAIITSYNSFVLSKNKKVLESGDGIIGTCVEQTIKNIGKVASDGMVETDETIIEIMTE